MSKAQFCLLVSAILLLTLVIAVAGLETTPVVSQDEEFMQWNEIIYADPGKNIMFDSSQENAYVLIPYLYEDGIAQGINLAEMNVQTGDLTTLISLNETGGSIVVAGHMIIYDSTTGNNIPCVKVASENSVYILAYNRSIVDTNPPVEYPGTYIMLKNTITRAYEIWQVLPVSGSNVFNITTIDDSSQEVESFYYDPQSNTVFLSIYDYNTGSSSIYKYDAQNPSGELLYSAYDKYVTSLLVHDNNKLYGVVVSGAGDIRELIEYDLSQKSTSFINIDPPPSFSETFTYFNVRGETVVLKVLSNKIVFVSDLKRYVSGSGEDGCYYVGLSYYDPSSPSNQAVFWGYINLTRINETVHVQADELSNSLKDVVESAGGYRVALAWHEWIYDVYHGVKIVVTDIQHNTGSGGGGGGPPFQPLAYHMERLFSFGGPTSSYTVLDYHAVNQTFGYITASSATVMNKVVLENTRGIAVVSVNFTGAEGQPVNATMLLDNRSLMIPYGSVLLGDSILFYGSSLEGEKGFLALYNTTENTTLSQEFSEYRPFVQHLLLIQTSESGQGSEWLMLIEANGTLVNTTLQGTTPVLKRLWSLENLSDWNSNATHGLVTWAADSSRNLTVIVSVEPSDTSDPMLKAYILTPENLTRLPLNTSIVFKGVSWSNITLNGALVVDYPGSLALITLYDNQTGYAHAYLLNYTSGGISDIYSNATTRMYRVSASSLGTLVGGSVLNTTTGLYEARIFTFDSQTLQFQETAEYAGIGSNEETLVATVLNNTFLLGIGRSYASPDNLTLTGTDTSTAYPVPEAWITPLLMIIASTTALFVFLRKNQKQENKSLL